MNKKMIVLIIFLILLLLVMPVLINILLSIDWFSNLVIGEETAWLSFYGSYLGGILGGILTLVGVVMTIRYQDKLRKKEIEEAENVKLRVIDNVTERAFLSLFHFAAWTFSEEKISSENIEMLRKELVNYKRASKEVHNVPLKVISANFFPEYTHNRDLIGIIEVELASILENNKVSDNEIKKRLKSVAILSRTKWIIKNHLKFTMDEKRKEERESLLEEFNGLEYKYRKSSK